MIYEKKISLFYTQKNPYTPFFVYHKIYYMHNRIEMKFCKSSDHSKPKPHYYIRLYFFFSSLLFSVRSLSFWCSVLRRRRIFKCITKNNLLFYAVSKSHGWRLRFPCFFLQFFVLWLMVSDCFYFSSYTWIHQNHSEPNQRKDHHFCQQNRIQFKCSSSSSTSFSKLNEYCPEVKKNMKEEAHSTAAWCLYTYIKWQLIKNAHKQ